LLHAPYPQPIWLSIHASLFSFALLGDFSHRMHVRTTCESRDTAGHFTTWDVNAA